MNFLRRVLGAEALGGAVPVAPAGPPPSAAAPPQLYAVRFEYAPTDC
jgi:hypothetical protein